MVYLFQNTMVFTIEYDGILTNNLWLVFNILFIGLHLKGCSSCIVSCNIMIASLDASGFVWTIMSTSLETTYDKLYKWQKTQRQRGT